MAAPENPDDPTALKQRIARLETELELANNVLSISKAGYAIENFKTGEYFASPGLRAMVGFSQQDPPKTFGEVLTALSSPQVAEASRERRARARATGEPYRTRLSLRHLRTGAPHVFELSNTPIRGTSGEVEQMYSLAIDITERAKLEDEVERERILLVRSQQFARMGHFVYFPNDDSITFSGFPAAIAGLAPSQTTRPAADVLARVLAPAQVRACWGHMRRAMQSPEAYQFELDLQLPGASDVHVLKVSAETNRNEAGEVESLFGVVIDITNERSAEKELRQQHEQLSKAERLANLGYFYHDWKSKNSFYSAKVFEFYGVDPPSEPWFGVGYWRDCFAPGEFERISALFASAYARRDTRIGVRQVMRRRSDGDLRHLISEREIEYDENGDVAFEFGVVRDISEAVLAAKERSALIAALEANNRTESLNFFAAELAHELNNMLQPAQSYGELALDAFKGSDERTKRYILQTLAAVERARDLTSLTLRQTRPTEATLSPTQAGRILEDARPLLAVATRPAIQWRTTEAASHALLATGPTPVLQALLNLVRNAVSAGGPNTHISIGVDLREDQLWFRVADDGPGVDSDIVDRLFQPLFTIADIGVGGGSGLGLAITRQLLRRHGGDIALADPAEGEGACFEFWLPVAND